MRLPYVHQNHKMYTQATGKLKISWENGASSAYTAHLWSNDRLASVSLRWRNAEKIFAPKSVSALCLFSGPTLKCE